MIPKTLHYCWFGGAPLSSLAQKCIDSWKKVCPDYEIVRWDESNFDPASFAYASEAYQAGKWAFVSDVARLSALLEYGGIYLDTDVELISSPEELRRFEAVAGFESDTAVATAMIGAEAGQAMIKAFLDEYASLHFVRDGCMDLTTNVARLSALCEKCGLRPNGSFQIINGLAVLPKDYLCPKDFDTGKVSMTNRTIAIHHFDGSWLSDRDVFFQGSLRRFRTVFPEKLASKAALASSTLKYEGVGGLIGVLQRKFHNK